MTSVQEPLPTDMTVPEPLMPLQESPVDEARRIQQYVQYFYLLHRTTREHKLVFCNVMCMQSLCSIVSLDTEDSYMI